MQNVGDNVICRFCLKSFDCNFEYIEAVTIEVLEVLGLKLDLNVIERSAICETCSANIQKCFDFKTICLYTEDYIYSFRNNRNKAKLDLKKIYLKKNENENIAVLKYHTICRLCMEIVGSDCYRALDDEAKEMMSVKEILRRCFSELDLDATKNPVICTFCYESLHSYFNFVTNCAGTDTEAIGDNSQVDSKSVFHLFVAENVPNKKNGSIDVYKNCNKTELCDEINEREEVDGIEVETLSNVARKLYEKQQNYEIGIKCEYSVNTESNEYNIKHEEIHIKSDDGDTAGNQDNLPITRSCKKQLTPHIYNLDKHLPIHRTSSAVKVYRCDICAFETKVKKTLKQHMFIHRNSSEATTYSCTICTHQTNEKRNLKRHMLVHKNASEITMYSCVICAYTGKRKEYLKRHMVTHKNVSESTTYSCPMCEYTTKYRSNFTLHNTSIHKKINASEVTMYTCEMCPYQTKRTYTLRRHMLTHKNASEVTMYSCAMCPYKTKLKNNLTVHFITHKNASEVTTYSCDICMYETKRKNHLRQHMWIHRNNSETFSCGVCTYKSKIKRHLKHHMLVHKHASEVNMYQCELCKYKTRYKFSLTKHMLVHKNASEVPAFFCEMCTFQTKRKKCLVQHMLMHKDPSEITMYPCEVCAYKTRNIYRLREHSLIHKKFSEVTTYSCEVCTYKTKMKAHLKHHMLIHKKASEVRMYQCDICTYKTRHQSSHKRHMGIHKAVRGKRNS